MKDVRVTALRHGEDELIVISRPIRATTRSAKTLTPAEVEVAKLVAAGLGNAEIALLRGRSERTIANQVASVLQKLGAPSRHHLGRFALAEPSARPMGRLGLANSAGGGREHGR